MKLAKDFYDYSTLDIAQKLLGKVFIYNSPFGRLAGIITETEAYTNYDKGSHAFGNKITLKNKTMFMDAGYLYVYFIYGMYFCMNIVTEKKGIGSAVLLRGMEPMLGQDIMIANRNYKKKNLKDLLNGPGKICQAFGIDKQLDGICLWDNESAIYIEDKKFRPLYIEKNPRIGLGKGKDEDLLWRFSCQKIK